MQHGRNTIRDRRKSLGQTAPSQGLAEMTAHAIRIRKMYYWRAENLLQYLLASGDLPLCPDLRKSRKDRVGVCVRTDFMAVSMQLSKRLASKGGLQPRVAQPSVIVLHFPTSLRDLEWQRVHVEGDPNVHTIEQLARFVPTPVIVVKADKQSPM
jgi:hypothetical protein